MVGQLTSFQLIPSPEYFFFFFKKQSLVCPSMTAWRKGLIFYYLKFKLKHFVTKSIYLSIYLSMFLYRCIFVCVLYSCLHVCRHVWELIFIPLLFIRELSRLDLVVQLSIGLVFREIKAIENVHLDNSLKVPVYCWVFLPQTCTERKLMSYLKCVQLVKLQITVAPSKEIL